jgi:hypothetical protein
MDIATAIIVVETTSMKDEGLESKTLSLAWNPAIPS